MRFIHDTYPPVLEMSRRNLTALLAALDDPASVPTLLSRGATGEPVMLVLAVEDPVHRSDRPTGDTVMSTAGAVWEQPAGTGHDARLACVLDDLDAQRYQPERVVDLLSELREVLGVPRDTWIPIDGLDETDEMSGEGS